MSDNWQPPIDPDEYEMGSGTRRQPPEQSEQPAGAPLSDTQKISEIAANWNRPYQRQQDPGYGEPFPGESGGRMLADGYGYAPRRRHTRRRNLFGACLALTGAFLAFGVVAVIVAAILLPSIYRAQRPEMQEIWCNRAQKIGASFVCDWKPTPPAEFAPPVVGTPIEDPFAILTPATATPDGAQDSGSAGAPAATQEGIVITATPSFTPAATHTPTHTPTATLLPTATIAPTATPVPRPVSFKLDTTRLTPHAQTWNNCGPATLSMGLSYFGYTRDQAVAARVLKPNAEDKNVSPYQMVNYVNQHAVEQVNTRAMYRVGGDMEMLKTLVSQGFPVILEKGYDVSDLGWMGHYLLIIGYDDTLQTFYTYDSYLGHGNRQGLQETYADVEHFWQHFNYTFIALYEPAREQQLLTLLGHRADPIAAAQGALEIARQQASINPNDNWAWFNLGTSYSILGDHERAAQAFDQAFLLGMPWRTLWYRHEPYTSYFALGRYDDILAHAQATESTTVYVEETFFYRGAVLAARGDAQGAIAQFQRALTYNSNFEPAQVAIQSLQNGTFSPQMVLTVGLGG